MVHRAGGADSEALAGCTDGLPPVGAVELGHAMRGIPDSR